MMGYSILRRLAVTAVIAAGALALPSMASAVTPPPPLQTGDTQAFASLTSGGPPITAPIARRFLGTWTISLGSFTITCTDVTTNVDFDVDGTGSVGSMLFPSCNTNVAGCDVDMSGTGVPWGTRLVRDAAGVFRERINFGPATGSPLTDQGMAFAMSAGCPYPTPTGYSLPFFGVLSPAVTGGIPASMTFNNLSGVLSSPLFGAITITGTSGDYSGEALYPVL